jgi:hypothetical protein
VRIGPRTIIGVALALAATAAGGCGSSDEDQIRELVALYHAPESRADAERVCRARTARAEAQMTRLGLAGAGPFAACVSWLDPSELTGAASASVAAPPRSPPKITVRGDRALVVDNRNRLGLRKVAGTWKLDNLVDPSLDGRPPAS